jgi:hypothetical protein
MMVLAQRLSYPSAGIGQWAIWAVAVLAVLAIVYVAARAFGVAIPGWLIQVLWIVLAAVVCILAIRFVLSL